MVASLYGSYGASYGDPCLYAKQSEAPSLIRSDLVAASMMDSGLCARESYLGFAFAGFSTNLTSPVAVGKPLSIPALPIN